MTTYAAAQQAAQSPDGASLGHALARRIFQRIGCGRLTLTLPNGKSFHHDTGRGGPEAQFHIHRWRALRRLFLAGDIGFAEAYIDGDWDSPDVTALIELGALSQDRLREAKEGTLPAKLFSRVRHAMNANTRAGSRRNIMRHYDLGNAFYEIWLDAGMNYSSAIFAEETECLEQAQSRKQDRILDLLALRPGQSVLEIGCGWGGLAERIAALGCRVTGLTLSPAQRSYAVTRLARAQLEDRAEILLRDYRDCDTVYDRIVSVEMIEAVGELWWPRYFTTLRQNLASGGHVVLQAITIDESKFDAYRQGTDFIQRYVFPGGMLPSADVIRRQAATAGMTADLVETFGGSYARTLADWRARFEEAWPRIAALGFSEKFRRLWRYYLCYCEAGFRCRHINVGLWVLRPYEC